jgi:hypothetical protein
VADLIDHIHQAQHNEECANFLIRDKPNYRDWAITAAFYAAVHLVEACFTSRGDIGHTEMAQDRGNKEMHQYREDKVRELARPAYNSYRKLREASRFVRYIAKDKAGHRFALDYYDKNAAHKLITIDLPNIRTELAKAFGINLS